MSRENLCELCGKRPLDVEGETLCSMCLVFVGRNGYYGARMEYTAEIMKMGRRPPLFSEILPDERELWPKILKKWGIKKNGQ